MTRLSHLLQGMLLPMLFHDCKPRGGATTRGCWCGKVSLPKDRAVVRKPGCGQEKLLAALK